MKDIISRLNKVFESRVRLGVMSLLMVEDWVHYSAFREAIRMEDGTKITDGNLASHLKKLRQEDYIAEKKEFRENKPHTTYRATPAGRKAFEEHLDALEELIRGIE